MQKKSLKIAKIAKKQQNLPGIGTWNGPCCTDTRSPEQLGSTLAMASIMTMSQKVAKKSQKIAKMAEKHQKYLELGPGMALAVLIPGVPNNLSRQGEKLVTSHQQNRFSKSKLSRSLVHRHLKIK